jgi:Tol biopolymer transport system component
MKNATVAIVLMAISHVAFSQMRMDFQNPPNEPALLGEGFISTSINERDFALSPDGNEIFFTVSTPQSTFQTIVFSQKDKSGNWSKPEIVSFAGKFSDLEPAFTADGKKLYFASNRPVEGSKPKDFDIWVVERKGNTWGEPRNLGAPVNTDADEFYPSIAKSGNLYFTAQYKDGVGREDIFLAQWKNNVFEKPMAMDTAINTKGFEFNAFVDQDETFILFTGYGRKDDTGRGDLYMSLKDTDGKWLPAKNVNFINSSKLDYCPYVSSDKKILFFTSERGDLPVSFESRTNYDEIQKINQRTLNGTGNIFWISFDAVLKAIRQIR